MEVSAASHGTRSSRTYRLPCDPTYIASEQEGGRAAKAPRPPSCERGNKLVSAVWAFCANVHRTTLAMSASLVCTLRHGLHRAPDTPNRLGRTANSAELCAVCHPRQPQPDSVRRASVECMYVLLMPVQGRRTRRMILPCSVRVHGRSALTPCIIRVILCVFAWDGCAISYSRYARVFHGCPTRLNSRDVQERVQSQLSHTSGDAGRL